MHTLETTDFLDRIGTTFAQVTQASEKVKDSSTSSSGPATSSRSG